MGGGGGVRSTWELPVGREGSRSGGSLQGLSETDTLRNAPTLFLMDKTSDERHHMAVSGTTWPAHDKTGDEGAWAAEPATRGLERSHDHKCNSTVMRAPPH